MRREPQGGTAIRKIFQRSHFAFTAVHKHRETSLRPQLPEGFYDTTCLFPPPSFFLSATLEIRAIFARHRNNTVRLRIIFAYSVCVLPLTAGFVLLEQIHYYISEILHRMISQKTNLSINQYTRSETTLFQTIRRYHFHVYVALQVSHFEITFLSNLIIRGCTYTNLHTSISFNCFYNNFFLHFNYSNRSAVILSNHFA